MKLADLPPYSGHVDGATCSKCGYDDFVTLHLRNSHNCYRSNLKLACEGIHQPDCCHFEHMHRWCTRCRYTWIEAPLDAGQP